MFINYKEDTNSHIVVRAVLSVDIKYGEIFYCGIREGQGTMSLQGMLEVIDNVSLRKQ